MLSALMLPMVTTNAVKVSQSKSDHDDVTVHAVDEIQSAGKKEEENRLR